MAEWNHNVCERCWFTDDALQTNEDGTFRRPTQVRENQGICCLCGVPTVSGIYIRRQAEECLCRGDHEHPEKWSPILDVAVEP